MTIKKAAIATSGFSLVWVGLINKFRPFLIFKFPQVPVVGKIPDPVYWDDLLAVNYFPA